MIRGNWRFAGIAFFSVMTFLSKPMFADDSQQLSEAVRKGIKKLLSEQKDDGSWQYNDTEGHAQERSMGLTALAALALHENGILPTDIKLQRAIRYVRSRAAGNADTYSVACATMLLARLNFREDRELIRALANKLIAGQGVTGCWHYDVPRSVDTVAGGTPVASGTELGDLSVTQFAAIALWQAQASGANIGAALVRARARLAWGQTANGGFNYAAMRDVPFHARAPEGPPGNSPDSASMSTAGTFIWVIAVAYDVAEAKRKGIARTRSDLYTASSPIYAELQKGAPDRKGKLGFGGPGKNEGQSDYRYPIVLPPAIDQLSGDPLDADKSLTKAMDRVDEWAKSMLGRGSAYYLWTVARLGVLMGREQFGGINWYDAGAKSLLASQKEDGGWDGSQTVYQPGPETCFALLFLSRVNLGSDIPRLLGRNPPQPFSIEGRDNAKFGSLGAAIAAAKDGDKISVTGFGPYKISPTDIAKSVTIQCARGADPILAFAGPSSRPMFTVLADAVAFEGIRFQVDTPTPVREPGTKFIPKPEGQWVLFDCQGKSLRFLNCSLTSQGRTPAVALQLNKSGKVFCRNCLLGGFNPIVQRPEAGAAANVMLKDCIGHGSKIVEAAGAAEFNCWFIESAFTANDIYDFRNLSGGFTLTNENNAVKTERLFISLGTGGERSWSGQGNLFDVKTWVAEGTSKVKEIYSLADWRTYWQTEEKGSKTGSAPFENSKRQAGPIRHDVPATEWLLDPLGVARIMRLKSKDTLGANIFMVGAGNAYSYFKESPEYANWHRIKMPSER